jgi:hypothetical protein
MLLSGSELRLTLILPEFRDDLRTASFGALLLGNGIVSACQAGGSAVLARPRSIANALDLSPVTGVAGSFDDWWCGRRG